MNTRAAIAMMAFTACSGVGDGMEAERGAELASSPCDTSQLFGAPTHAGNRCAPLSTMNVMATFDEDPAAAAKNADLGFYSNHSAQPLTRGAWVYTVAQSGFTDLDHKDSITRSVHARRFIGSQPVEQWSYASRYKPVEAGNNFGSAENYFESLFQPVIVGDSIFVPESAGRVAKLDLATGAVQAIIDPFAGTPFSGDADTIVNSALSTNGTEVWYTAVAWEASHSRNFDPRGAWVVKVNASTNAATIKPWSEVATAAIGVKQAGDLCTYPFSFASPVPAYPWPGPDPTSVGPQLACSAQRPALNAAIAFTRNGQAILTSTARRNLNYGYLIGINAASLAPVWSGSFRNKIDTGCGFAVPYASADPNAPLSWACRDGAGLGVDHRTGERPAGQTTGILGNAPVVLPDDRVFMASYQDLNNNVGHSWSFSLATTPVATVTTWGDYGWENVPGIDDTIPDEQPAGSHYRLIHSLNSFSPTTGDGQGLDGHYLAIRTRPDALWLGEYPFEPAKDPSAVANDFLTMQPPIDTDGNNYHLRADGTLYKLNREMKVQAQVNLGISMETMGVKPAWGVDGAGNPVLYVPYAGKIYVIGSGAAMSPATVTAIPVTGSQRRGANVE